MVGQRRLGSRPKSHDDDDGHHHHRQGQTNHRVAEQDKAEHNTPPATNMADRADDNDDEDDNNNGRKGDSFNSKPDDGCTYIYWYYNRVKINNNKSVGELKSRLVSLFIYNDTKEILKILHEHFIRYILPIRKGRSFARVRKNIQSKSKHKTFTNFR